MKTCPHCGATRFTLRRPHTVCETFILDSIDDQGNYTELDSEFGETEHTGAWESASCAGCSEALDLALLFPPPETPTMTRDSIHATAQEIIEEALAAEPAWGEHAHSHLVAECLDAIAAAAKNIWDATAPGETTP